MPKISVLDLQAGAGGQLLGLERAGFQPIGAVERDLDSRATIEKNRSWLTVESVAAWELIVGSKSPEVIVANLLKNESSTLTVEAKGDSDPFISAINAAVRFDPRAFLLQGVPSYMSHAQRRRRMEISDLAAGFGFQAFWRTVDSSHFGVPHARRRAVLVAIRPEAFKRFDWPAPTYGELSVGDLLLPYMSERGWPGAAKWAELARGTAPTLIGGSKRHGGADLGPTRTKQSWLALGIDPRGLADQAPGREFMAGSLPRLTNRMAAALQGFPEDWAFSGSKTSVYRQVAAAVSPLTAESLGRALFQALSGREDSRSMQE